MRDAADDRHDRSMNGGPDRAARRAAIEDDRAMQLPELLVAAMAVITVVLLALAR